jgi:hypothetical protein
MLPRVTGGTSYPGSCESCNHANAILDAALPCSPALRGLISPPILNPATNLILYHIPAPDAMPILPLSGPPLQIGFVWQSDSRSSLPPSACYPLPANWLCLRGRPWAISQGGACPTVHPAEQTGFVSRDSGIARNSFHIKDFALISANAIGFVSQNRPCSFLPPAALSRQIGFVSHGRSSAIP